MVIRSNSNKNTRKNNYRKDDSIKIKHSKIKSMLIRKQNVEKEEERYIQKIRLHNLSRLIFSIVLGLFIFASIVWGSIAIYQYAIESKYFAIQEIKFSGNKFLTDEELKFITRLELNKNILTYEISQIERQLLENAWIESVRIKRSLPNKMHIEVKEREPIFWATKDDILYYLDKEINFIAPVSEDKFIALPTIDIKYATEDAIKNLPDFIDALKVTQLPFSISEVSWFSINHGKGYEFYLDKYNLNISLDIENWEKNIQNLEKVMQDLEKRNEIRKIKEIRAAHNQVTIVKN